jgi:hypothetical protein
MSMVIVTSNVEGLLIGEWRGAQASTLRLSWLGLAALVAAIVVIAHSA